MTRVIGLPNGKNITVLTLNDVYDVVREYVGDDAVEFIKDSMEEEYFHVLNDILKKCYKALDNIEDKDLDNDDGCLVAYNEINDIVNKITSML